MYTTPASTTQVRLGVGIDTYPLKSLYNAERISRGLTHERTERFTAVDDCVGVLERLECAITHSERDYDGELTVTFERPGLLGYLNRTRGERNAYLTIAARSRTVVDEEHDRLVEQLRATDITSTKVAMRFWSQARNGGTFARRVLDAETWPEIAANYPRAVRERLGGMFDIASRDVGGLALWYGPPGTGKTSAVRALALAWRPWCDVHVVVDPEQLLRSPSYLMQVITTRSYEEDLPEGAVAEEARSRLIVLEDAGELLATDARREAGQGLSRLLNVTDGLIGRGLATSILVTTNEELGSLHPAIRRPGRCWAQLRFGRFSGPEARGWLADRNVEAALDVDGSRSLAELFAMERGEELEENERELLGFRA